MLELIRENCRKTGIGTVLHTGSVPQKKRRDEINRFKNDPEARVFLSSDSGGVGLNLQNASVVINCDLPWNPAKLEQRIARVWRKHQQRAVTVINLVSENTIEHRMIETLATKQGLADAVLDRTVDFSAVKMKGGGQKFFERLEQLMGNPAPAKPPEPVTAAEQPAVFAERLAEELGTSLLTCEERTAGGKSKIVITVDGNREQIKERVSRISTALFGKDQDIEILDRPTAETLARLIESGLLQPVGQTRSLYPAPKPAQLSDETKARMMELKTGAERTLSMARLLIENGFTDGAVTPLQKTVRQLTVFQALEKGLHEPEINEEEATFADTWPTEVVEFMKTSSAGAAPLMIAILEDRLS
jgi:hypothetical protein